jgi:hypothetical protein
LTELCGTLKEDGIKTVSVVRVVRPLFKLALDQSNVSKDPVKENAALLQTLSLFCLRRGLDRFVTAEKAAKVIPREYIGLTLWGRQDLVSHFFVLRGLLCPGAVG